MQQVQPQNEIEVEEPDFASSLVEYIVRFFSFLFVLATFPLTIWGCAIIIKEYEKGVVFVLGRIRSKKPKAPGLHFALPGVDEYRIVDMRTKTFDVPPQQVLTEDSVAIGVDAVVFWRVFNATMKVAKVENAEANTVLLAQSTIRNVLGTKNLTSILSHKEEIAYEVQQYLDKATDIWGIKVEKVEIKDIKIPPQMQRGMAAEAEAAREAKARVISAEGEMLASKKLKEAADIMNDSPNAIHLRYLQTLTSMSGKDNKAIILPLPSNVIQNILKKKNSSKV